MMLSSVLECLDEEAIAAFVAGSLDAPGLARVESHVARCAACQNVVADAAYGAMGNTSAVSSFTRRLGLSDLQSTSETASPVSNTPWQRALPEPGDVLAGKYRVDRILGRGGMGTVFSAYHLELGHRVAIKILHRGGPTGVARFLREAQTCAQLANEHIVRAFDLGRLPGGAPYLVMEYLVGEDLSRVVARGPLPIVDAVRYVMQACEALADAHAAGIVHRDLKPANLFLSQRAQGVPCIKVVDFGISKVMGEEENESGPALTSTGMILGSPSYMSPEQIRANDVDARTDIWSLGVILYELLTGRPPFSAPSFSALSVAIATEPAASPSSWRSQIDPGLDRLVRHCLQKQPGDRIASVVELRRALAPFAIGSVHTGTHPVSQLLRRTLSSARRALTTAAVALAIAGAGTVVATRTGPISRAQPPTPRATLADAILAARRAPPSMSLIPITASVASSVVDRTEPPALNGTVAPAPQHSAARRKRWVRPITVSSAVPGQLQKSDPTATPD